ncbi:MAG: hypothetical protein A2051_02290 [Desulfovibrionales bacterium GWA2_65_9]|nr:MAG: hypothetical protein A2051_02290 [Desulfovibrionales bacterium GWA2_65_9]
MPRRAAMPLMTPLLTVCVLCALALPALAESKQAPSKQARELRAAGDLVPYAPPQAVLKALFSADEDAPRGVYGPVSAYVKTRACPTTWLIEKGERTRIEELAARKGIPPYEFSLTLEEDCPGKVTHAVFVTSPGSTPEAWLKWRSQFHGRKAARHYGAALENLKKAEAAGLAPTAELRFLAVNGELLMQNLEDVLRAEGRLAPVFDLEKGARTGK